MIFFAKKFSTCKMLKMLKTVLKKRSKSQILSCVGKNPRFFFHNFKNMGVEKWKTFVSVQNAQHFHLTPKTAKKCLEKNGRKNDIFFKKYPKMENKKERKKRKAVFFCEKEEKYTIIAFLCSPPCP